MARIELVSLNKEQSMVREFHRKFDVLEQPYPHLIDHDTFHLRCSLIREETDEFWDAGEKGDLVKVADALADLLYVVYGTAISYGIDLEEIFQEVHLSNMTKSLEDRASNGKVLKGKNWRPPDIAHKLWEQL